MSRQERKSRRTHKNLKDGCPNCRAKRIKCTEELPQCHNCVKRNHRCGYMDFPQEKLVIIRMKNERKSRELRNQLQSLNSHPPDKRLFDSPQIVNLHINNISRTDHTVTMEEPPMYQSVIMEQKHHVGSIEGSRIVSNHISATSGQVVHPHDPYHGSSANHNNNTSDVHLRVPTQIQEHNIYSQIQQLYSVADQGNKNDDTCHKNLHNNNVDRIPNDHSTHSYEVGEYPSQSQSHEQNQNSQNLDVNMNLVFYTPYEEANYSHFKDLTYDDYVTEFRQNGGSTAPLQPLYNSNFQHGPQYVSQVHNEYATQGHANDISSLGGKPTTQLLNNFLPNALHMPTTFKRLQTVDRLKNRFLERYLKHHRGNIKDLNNLEFRNVAPVWNYRIAETFWTSVYNQAEVLDLYFLFFLDRSLNALLKRCMVNLDDEKTLSSDRIANNSALKCCNRPFLQEELKHLTDKLYTYYGHLIKDLRELLIKIHLEYPAKISLFAAWLTFLHSHSLVETYCLLFLGTTALFSKVFDSAQVLNEIPPTLNTGYYFFVNHLNWLLIPDYDFSVIRELYGDLNVFQSHCKEWIDLGDDSIKTQYLQIARHIQGLQLFLERLTDDYYPRICEVNRICKDKSQRENERGICFVQVRVFYDLLSHWFRIFPSEAIPVGLGCPVIGKTFYLFFPAIGKALTHILSPIRSLMSVDPCNTFCPRTDFEFDVYKITPDNGPMLQGQKFQFLNNTSQKLLRIISFFNLRILFYLYYFLTVTVLDSKYIQRRPDFGFTEEVLEITPMKPYVEEVYLTLFDKSVQIEPKNFPIMNGFRDELIRLGRRQQANRTPANENHFDYQSGIYENDFNPNKWIELITMRQQQAWEEERTTLQQLQFRMHNFNLVRQEVYRSVQKSSNDRGNE